jgi:hypothetical protein
MRYRDGDRGGMLDASSFLEVIDRRYPLSQGVWNAIHRHSHRYWNYISKREMVRAYQSQ